MEIEYEWRGRFASDELNHLHAEGFEHAVLTHDWLAQVESHSLGWVTARERGRLVGFVNVPWDGATHAFLVDTLVAADRRHHGIGTKLVHMAADGARAAGCEWLHVDFERHLEPFYFDGCGFRSTPAGLMEL